MLSSDLGVSWLGTWADRDCSQLGTVPPKAGPGYRLSWFIFHTSTLGTVYDFSRDSYIIIIIIIVVVVVVVVVVVLWRSCYILVIVIWASKIWDRLCLSSALTQLGYVSHAREWVQNTRVYVWYVIPLTSLCVCLCIWFFRFRQLTLTLSFFLNSSLSSQKSSRRWRFRTRSRSGRTRRRWRARASSSSACRSAGVSRRTTGPISNQCGTNSNWCARECE